MQAQLVYLIKEIVLPTLQAVTPAITKYISNVVLPALGTVAPAITDFIEETVLPSIATILPAITYFIKTTVVPELVKITPAITDFLKEGVIPAIANLIEASGNLIIGVVLPAITEAKSAIASLIVDTLMPTILDIIPALSTTISLVANEIVAKLTESTEKVSKLIAESATHISLDIGESTAITMATILNATTALAQHIDERTSVIIGGLEAGITALLQMGNLLFQLTFTFQGFVNAVLRLPEVAVYYLKWPDALTDNLAIPIAEGLFERFVVNIRWVPLEEWKPPYWREIPPTSPAFEIDLPFDVGRRIRPQVGIPMFGNLELFFSPLANIAEWATDYIIKHFEEARASLWTLTGETIAWLTVSIKDLWAFKLPTPEGVGEIELKDIFIGFFSWVGETGIVFFKLMWGATEEILEPITKALKPLLHEIFDAALEDMSKSAAKQTYNILKKGTPAEGSSPEITIDPEVIIPELHKLYAGAGALALIPLWGILPVRFVHMTLINIGQWLAGLDKKITIDLRPFGVGASFEFNISKALGFGLAHLAREIKLYLDEVGRAIVYGFAIWASQPIARALNFVTRNAIPIELPTLPTIIEFIRRSLPHEKLKEHLTMAWYYMALYGYSDYAINIFLQDPEAFNIKVKDRFGVERTIPLALVYALPSATDVAIMMVRDIFATIKDFQELYAARGMTEDIGALYYFLRFRYPPPERLWDFTTRGIKGFASDNLIYIDTLADIPGKIDQRWMIKWGIYQALAEKDVTPTDPIHKFLAIFEPGAAPPPLRERIYLDIANFCRTLQATGLHPIWVPLVAVAETMNALTEERTLLRTGFLNLFEHGFWNVEALEALLAGFVKTTFDAVYFDLEELAWKEIHTTLPVAYLPPERKLLELRALMDRSLRILRDIQDDVSRAYQQYIVWDYNQFKAKLIDVIKAVNEFFTADYKAITGEELPEQLQLTFVEAYYRPYVEALKTMREVYTIRRIRAWTQRWLGWTMYRLAYGAVVPQDFKRLLDYVTNYAKLTKPEANFIQGIMEILAGIAQREYAPTPSQLATIVELVPEARQLFNNIMEARRIPEEWRPIWERYIDIRPIITDIKKMYSRIEDLYTYFIIDTEAYLAALQPLKAFGYTDNEIKLIFLTSEYERQRRAWSEAIGDVDRMMALAEYSPMAQGFALTIIHRMIDILKIDEETKALLKEMWSQYIRVRPVYDEVRRYITELIADFVEDIITEDEFQAELEALKEWGLSDNEIMFYKTIAGLRKARYLKRRAKSS